MTHKGQAERYSSSGLEPYLGASNIQPCAAPALFSRSARRARPAARILQGRRPTNLGPGRALQAGRLNSAECCALDGFCINRHRAAFNELRNCSVKPRCRRPTSRGSNRRGVRQVLCRNAVKVSANWCLHHNPDMILWAARTTGPIERKWSCDHESYRAFRRTQCRA